MDFFTEILAARSIEALRALGRRSARIRRGGHVRVIPAEELVPGDIVLVESGDAISADLRIVEASHLGADESTLTGESVPVEKGTEPVVESARITERCCMLFKGTAAIRGSGVGVVVGTGLNTELGRHGSCRKARTIAATSTARPQLSSSLTTSQCMAGPSPEIARPDDEIVSGTAAR